MVLACQLLQVKGFFYIHVHIHHPPPHIYCTYYTILLYHLTSNYNNNTLAVVYRATFRLLINFSFVNWSVILSDRIRL